MDSTPHFNSVNNYLADPKLTETLKGLVTLSSLPLKAVETDFAVDSSGFSTSRFVRWYNKKYGKEVGNRQWIKCHLMCGVRTKVVTSVDISGWTAHDTNYFVPLLEATAEHFQLGDVLVDKAYLSRKNLKAVEEIGGTPFVSFKFNTVEPTEEEEPIWARMYYYFMYNRLTFTAACNDIDPPPPCSPDASSASNPGFLRSVLESMFRAGGSTAMTTAVWSITTCAPTSNPPSQCSRISSEIRCGVRAIPGR